MSKKENETTILADEMLGKSEAFIIKNKKIITGALLAIVICAMGFFAYTKFVAEPKEEKAATELTAAVAEFMMAQAPDYQTALDGDGVVPGFLSIIENYSGTDAGNIAKAYAGICYANLENYDEAIKHLEDFDGDDKIFAQKIKQTLGNCYAHKGEDAKAIEILLDAAEEADNVAVTPACWRDAAAMYEKQGNKEEAVKYYNRIKTEYPNCIYVASGEIDRQLNAMK